jgi:hypothetical protein
VWRIGGICDREIRKFVVEKVPQCHYGTTNPTWTAVVLNPKLFCEYYGIDEWVRRISGSCDREIKNFFGKKSLSATVAPQILYGLLWY